MIQRAALLALCAAPCFPPAGAVSGYGATLPPRMTLMQRRRQEKEEELIRQFGGDLGSCQTRHESSLQREQREALVERNAEESVRGAEKLLEEDARVREEERTRAFGEEEARKGAAPFRASPIECDCSRTTTPAGGLRL